MHAPSTGTLPIARPSESRPRYDVRPEAGGQSGGVTRLALLPSQDAHSPGPLQAAPDETTVAASFGRLQMPLNDITPVELEGDRNLARAA